MDSLAVIQAQCEVIKTRVTDNFDLWRTVMVYRPSYQVRVRPHCFRSRRPRFWHLRNQFDRYSQTNAPEQISRAPSKRITCVLPYYVYTHGTAIEWPDRHLVS